MKNISFCIPTAKNELDHIKLLMRSLQYNLSHLNHEIIVFIDTDNQGTFEWLKTQKSVFPNLRIIRNTLPMPICCRNITYMYEIATNEIVSHLQSDMVICKNYDVELLKHLDKNTIITSTRIEPPLHPPSPEKITHNFGVDPTIFNLEEFSTFAETCKKDRMTDFWFAPYTLYKEKWIELGGHDSLYRRSRDDSDLLYRLAMCGLQMKQIWNAIVYHFTCTSSRGPKWWDNTSPEVVKRNNLQLVADHIDMTKFLRKWPRFKHDTTFDPSKDYKHLASVNFTNVTPHNGVAILQNYHRFDKIFIDNESVRNTLRKEYDKFNQPGNILLDISEENWAKYKKYYRTWEFDDIFVSAPITNADVILNIDPQAMDVFTEPIILQMNDILHYQSQDGVGTYQCGTGTMTINTFPVPNRIQENLIVKNPPMADIQFEVL